jgi:hypothetical protein
MAYCALTKARQRQHAASHRACAGSVSLGGMTYQAAVVIDAVSQEYKQDGSGVMVVQRAHIGLSKCYMRTAPVLGSVARIAGNDYQVMEIGGQNEFSPAWTIECMRILPSS